MRFDTSTVRLWWKKGKTFFGSDKGFYFIGLLVGSLLNFVFNAFLGRYLSFENLALVTFVNTLWYLATLAIGPFGSTVNHETAYLTGRERVHQAHVFFSNLLVKGTAVMTTVSLLWVMLSPVFKNYFHIDHVLILLLFTPSFLLGFLSYAYQGFLQGRLFFRRVTAVFLFEAGCKLACAILFVFFGMSEWSYLAIPLSLAAAAIIGWAISRSDRRSFNVSGATLTPVVFPIKFFFSSMISVVSVVLFLSLDILLVKHYFSAVDAGQYALLSLVGKMIYFFGSLPSSFIVTLVSHKAGSRRSDRRVFHAIFFSVAGLCFLGVVFLGLLGGAVAPILFGEKALSIIAFLPAYTTSIALFTLSNALVLYHLAKRHYGFVFASLLSSVSMVIGISFFHESLESVVYTVFLTSFWSLAFLGLLHVSWKEVPFAARILKDFSDLFERQRNFPRPLPKGKKRILLLNWRDSQHMFAGGAEMYIEEIAKRWVKEGHFAALFCGNDGRSLRHEVRDGIHITRRGGFYLVYFWAFVYYVFRFRRHFDVIVDCHNGVPFFSPLYSRVQTFCLLHHVHQSIFYRFLPMPLAKFAAFLEKDFMPMVYRNIPFITVSGSSKHEMEHYGIGKAGISVVYPGADLDFFIPGQKSELPTILYLGRLKAYKSVDVLIRSFVHVLEKYPQATLVIAGEGDEKEILKNLAYATLRLPRERVVFLGFVSETKKRQLLQSSWMLVQPSSMEGWGIVAIEASACRTPVVASNVPGLRDSVNHPYSGFLVEHGDVGAFTDKMSMLIEDKALREKMGEQSWLWSRNFSWERSTKQCMDIIVHKKTYDETEIGCRHERLQRRSEY